MLAHDGDGGGGLGHEEAQAPGPDLKANAVLVDDGDDGGELGHYETQAPGPDLKAHAVLSQEGMAGAGPLADGDVWSFGLTAAHAAEARAEIREAGGVPDQGPVVFDDSGGRAHIATSSWTSRRLHGRWVSKYPRQNRRPAMDQPFFERTEKEAPPSVEEPADADPAAEEMAVFFEDGGELEYDKTPELDPESKTGAEFFDETPALGPESKAGAVFSEDGGELEYDKTPAHGPELKAGSVLVDDGGERGLVATAAESETDQFIQLTWDFPEAPRVNVASDMPGASNNPRSVWVNFQQPGWSSV